MAHNLYIEDTPAAVKNSRCFNEALGGYDEVKQLTMLQQGLHLITMSTPNGQKVQIMLEELADVYGTTWDTSFVYHFPSPKITLSH